MDRAEIEYLIAKGSPLQLKGVDLSNQDLSNLNLTGADLTNANLTYANLTGVNLSHANLDDAFLNGALLTEANLYGATLKGADLIYTDVTRTNFIRANLTEAHITRLVLSGSNCSYDIFDKTVIACSSITRCDFSHASLNGTTIYHTIMVANIFTGANLTGMTYNDNSTTIPPLVIDTNEWIVIISDTKMNIGCQSFLIKRWERFNDTAISKLHPDALTFWKQWKEPLLTLAKHHQKLVKEAKNEHRIP